MNAATFQSDHTKNIPSSEESMAGPFMASGLFHLLLIVLSIVGLPFVVKEPVIIATPIAVELVDIDELTQSERVSPQPVKPKDIEKPKPPQEKPVQEKPKPPKQVEEVSPPKPSPKPAENPKPKPVQEKPKPKPKPAPKPKDKPEPAPQTNDFQSLLKNLAPDEPEEVSSAGETSRLADRLTMSELDALKYQIAQCWNVPSGVKYAENLAVEIRVSINPDGTVNRTSVVDKGRYNRDSAFRAAADSAVRALANPRCSPLKLPAGKYNEWKNTVMTFDPKDML